MSTVKIENLIHVKKRIILHAFFFLFLFFIVGIKLMALDVGSLKSESVVLMNGKTGKILYSKDDLTLKNPASTAKIATCIYILDRWSNRLDELAVADQDSICSLTEEAKQKKNYTQPAWWLSVGASHIGIKKGEIFSIETLIKATMVASADDAANILARHLGGCVPDFMAGLNEYIKGLGCTNTHLKNPHGLYHPNQKTCAKDLAILTKHALKNDKFRQIITATQYVRPKTNKQEEVTYPQTNRLLRKGVFYYKYAIGVKTGYLVSAGNCLVAAAEKDDRLLIAVLLKAPDRSTVFKEAIQLFEAAFKEEKVTKTALKEKTVFSKEVIGGKVPLQVKINEPINFTYYPSEKPELKAHVIWLDTLRAPLREGELVGELTIADEQNETWHKSPLYATYDVQEKMHPLLWGLFALISFFFIFLLLRRKI